MNNMCIDLLSKRADKTVLVRIPLALSNRKCNKDWLNTKEDLSDTKMF